MASKKEPTFKSWDDVDNALKLISDIDKRLVEAQVVMNERIDKIKAESINNVRSIIYQKKQLEAAVEEFTKANITEFKEAKTRKFAFGEVGFRKTTSIVIRNVKAVLGSLKQHRMFDCIDTKESINKEKLADYSDEALEKIGAKRKAEDTYFYNIYTERIDS